MDNRAYSCIAQISGDSGVKGAGFLVPGGHVLTCAHVINQALGRRNDSVQRPTADDRVRVVFPWSGEGYAGFAGEVVAWHPLTVPHGPDTDIAVLKLEPVPPADLRPAWLQVLDQVSQVRVRTAGFPTGYTLGRHAQGRLEGADGGGMAAGRLFAGRYDIPSRPQRCADIHGRKWSCRGDGRNDRRQSP